MREGADKAAVQGGLGSRAQQAHATETQETCTQYNVLKIARYLFRWTGEAAFADFYERAILNGLIGTQRIPGNADYALPGRTRSTSAAVSAAAWPRWVFPLKI